MRSLASVVLVVLVAAAIALGFTFLGEALRDLTSRTIGSEVETTVMGAPAAAMPPMVHTVPMATAESTRSAPRGLLKKMKVASAATIRT